MLIFASALALVLLPSPGDFDSRVLCPVAETEDAEEGRSAPELSLTAPNEALWPLTTTEGGLRLERFEDAEEARAEPAEMEVEAGVVVAVGIALGASLTFLPALEDEWWSLLMASIALDNVFRIDDPRVVDLLRETAPLWVTAAIVAMGATKWLADEFASKREYPCRYVRGGACNAPFPNCVILQRQ